MSKSLPTTGQITETINTNVRAELARQGHTIEWLATDLGINVNSLLVFLSEKMPAALLWDISEVLNVPTVKLLDGVTV